MLRLAAAIACVLASASFAQLTFERQDGSIATPGVATTGVLVYPTRVISSWSFALTGDWATFPNARKRVAGSYVTGEAAAALAPTFRTHWGGGERTIRYGSYLGLRTEYTQDYGETNDISEELSVRYDATGSTGWELNQNDGGFFSWYDGTEVYEAGGSFWPFTLRHVGEKVRILHVNASTFIVQFDVRGSQWDPTAGGGDGTFVNPPGVPAEWVDVVEYAVEDWDGTYGTTLSTTAIVDAIQEFNGDFLEWQSSTKGWERMMSDPSNALHKGYLWDLRAYIQGSGATTTLKNADGTIVEALWSIESAVTSPASGGDDLTLTDPDEGFYSEQYTQHFSTEGWGVHVPTGSDSSTAKVYEWSISPDDWFVGSGMSAPGIPTMALTVDLSLYDTFRPYIFAIWWCFLGIWGMGRVWDELRRM